MQGQGLGELNIPSEPENLTATYVARPWSGVRKLWTFTTYSPLDKPTEVIGESMGIEVLGPDGTPRSKS
jgi:hypothetical protein